jgi:predicted Zn-dependent peptidase
MGINHQTERLPNGLTICAECDDDAHSAAAGFFVRTGARDESASVMGVSHFLEHMMFKGTDEISADALNRRFDEMGARNNAYTSGDLTAFHAHVLPEHLDDALELLGKMMRPALRDDDFTTEKGVILEEIAMYKDSPFWVLYEEAMDRHYAGGSLGHRVLGTSDTVTDLSSEQMRTYFNARYSADNTVVALAGKLDFAKVVDDVAKLCGKWQVTNADRQLAKPKSGAGRFELRDENVNRAYMIGISAAPAIDDDLRYAATLASQILGASDNSRLHWALIESGLADEAQAEYHGREGVGEQFVYASGSPDKAEEIWSVVERELAGLAASVTDDDLARLRGRMVTGVTLSGERPADRMQRIGSQWTLTGQYRPLEEELARIEAITVSDVRHVIEMFDPKPTTFGVLLPTV